MIQSELIRKLSQLAHIKIEDEEGFRDKLSGIIDHIERLKEVDTSGVPPCLQVIEGISLDLRDDEEGELYTGVVENAPDQIGGMVRVPAVFGDDA